MPDPAVENMQQAKLFAQVHIQACARDLLTWKTTSLLPEGKLRELGQILEPYEGDSALNVAEGIVTLLTLREVKALAEWKAEAQVILQDLDLPAIAKALNLRLGSNVAPQVLPGIQRLKRAIDEAHKS